MEILVERNQAVTIYFPMIKAGSNDFAIGTDWTPASGDVQFSEDGAAFANTTNLPTHEGNGIWSLALVATELEGERTVISIVDSATKAVEDQAIILLTWGDNSAGLPFNAIADFVLRRALASARASSWGDTVAFRSLLGAASKLVNRLFRSGSNLIIAEEDDATTFGTQAMTTDGAAEQITDLDTS